MGNELPRATRRLVEAAGRLGVEVEVVEMPASTRTAEEAAAACGCGVGQIVKSLVFRGSETGRCYLFLVSGANRVDEGKVSSDVGEALARPDAQFVRDQTGYAIGGVPPFGHDLKLATFMDQDLLRFDRVWAAAGTPRTVMRLVPDRLREATEARVIAVR
jgi:prolyl-tRNA editing enzyme YbaK/EbsC (Cys-tRNA(Pro) deacylase)